MDAVPHLRKSLFVLMALAWLLATNHCLLERLPSLEFISCCAADASGSHSGNDCDDDGCQAVESGDYKAGTARVVVAAPPISWTVSQLPSPLDAGSAVHFQREPRANAPPDLPKRWQFSRRTALPPRAPSFAS